MALARFSSIKFDHHVEEHGQLREAITDTRQVLAETDSPRATIAAALAALRDQLRIHFRHEEQEEGFFEVVVDQAPRLKLRADRLRDQHRALLNSFAQVARFADYAGPTWRAELNAAFEKFCRELCRHESDENDLMNEAFNQDVGSKD